MLAQAKRKIHLYKGGTSGFSNLGFEPYSELYAYQVAQVSGRECDSLHPDKRSEKDALFQV